VSLQLQAAAVVGSEDSSPGTSSSTAPPEESEGQKLELRVEVIRSINDVSRKQHRL
jgi:hypothetical protein